MNNDFYELRLYRVESGRMRDMATRWHEELAGLFAHHGVAPVGAWQALSGPNLPLFVYLMHWPDWMTRQTAWAGFYADPRWAEARARTNAGSELVERYTLDFLQGILPWSDAAAGPYVELRQISVRIGASAEARALVREKLADQISQHGGTILGALEHLTGADLPGMTMWISWPDDTHARVADPLFESPPLGRATHYQLAQI